LAQNGSLKIEAPYTPLCSARGCGDILESGTDWRYVERELHGLLDECMELASANIDTVTVAPDVSYLDLGNTPFLVTVLLAVLGWSITHEAERITASPYLLPAFANLRAMYSTGDNVHNLIVGQIIRMGTHGIRD
jgi:hypothetical protein